MSYKNQGSRIGSTVLMALLYSIAGTRSVHAAETSAAPAAASATKQLGSSPQTQSTAATVLTPFNQSVAVDGAWAADYRRARALLDEGQFSEAGSAFLALARTAPSQQQGVLAAELAQIAFSWQNRGLTLVERNALVGSDVEAKHSDHRTADEIGVLYTTAVVYGLGTGGWFDVQQEPRSVSAAVLPPLLLAGAAAGAVGLMDSGRGLRYGAAQSIASGMYIGLWQGIAWTTYVQASSSHQTQLSSKQYATALWGSATLGAVVGGVVGSQSVTTPGRASYVSSASLWPALILGLGAAAISSDERTQDDHAFLAASIGATGGVVAGLLTAGTVSPTTARVRFLDLGGLAGTLLGGGLYLAAESEKADAKSFALVTALGTSAGLTTAWLLTANMQRDDGAQRQRVAVDVHPQIYPLRGGASIGVSGVW